MSKQYNPGKIKPLIKIIGRILSKSPGLIMNIDNLMDRVKSEIPELKNKTHCANCGASMVQYEYNLNVIDIALVLGMAKAVKTATNKGKSFTDANIVHVPTLPVSDAVRHRTTRCAKLGLVAKYKKDGRQIKGTWVITRRGFAALKGEEIPTGIIVWRGETIERPGKTTTFAEAKKEYTIKVDKYMKKNNEYPKNSYIEEITLYHQNEWIDFAGLHEGRLF